MINSRSKKTSQEYLLSRNVAESESSQVPEIYPLLLCLLVLPSSNEEWGSIGDGEVGGGGGDDFFFFNFQIWISLNSWQIS